MHEDLEKLAALDRIDREIAKREGVIATGKSALTDAGTTVAQYESTKSEIEASLAENRTQQLALQRAITGHETNRDRARKALEMGHGSAEAAERQIERTSELIDEAETSQLELLEAQDEQEAALSKADEALAQAREKLATLNERVPAERAEEEAELAGLRTERTAVHGALPSHLSKRYDDFRARMKWAVAPIVDGTCGACQMEVPAQQRADLNRGLIEQCRRCYRWLIP